MSVISLPPLGLILCLLPSWAPSATYSTALHETNNFLMSERPAVLPADVTLGVSLTFTSDSQLDTQTVVERLHSRASWLVVR